jgi:hypothetical protein
MSFAAKIDDCVDAETLQLFQAAILGLSAAVEKVVYFAEIGYASNGNLLCDRELPGWGCVDKPGPAANSGRG